MALKLERRRKGVMILGAFALATAALCGLWWRELASALVTRLAFREAERLPAVQKGRELEDLSKRLEEKFRFWFERGLLDRRTVVQKMPHDGLVPEAKAGFIVLYAYYQVMIAWWKSHGMDEGEAIFQEYRRWLDPALLTPKSKEFLVNLLTGDWSVFPDPKEQAAGLAKSYLCSFLFGRTAKDPLAKFIGRDFEDYDLWKTRCLAALRPEHWQAILRDLKHPRDKVRAGSLLLLYHHPEESVFLEEARAALQDPSEWVRLAAAGVLALKGRHDGVWPLIRGLQHPRWEVRWWCGLGLAALGGKGYALLLALRQRVETDEFVKEELTKMAAEISGAKDDLGSCFRFLEIVLEALNSSCRIARF